MAGKKKGLARFDTKLHVVMSVLMRQMLRARAKSDNTSAAQIIRQLLADEFGLPQEHVTGPTELPFSEIQHPPVKSKSTKRLRDRSHPLEAAWGKHVTPKENND